MGNNYYGNFSMFRFNEDGSFTCKRPEEIECEELESLAIALLWETSLDFNLSGEDGCISNYDMYTPLYNSNNGMEYLIPYSDAYKWKQGEEITIYGKLISEEEYIEIERFMNS